MSRETEKPWNPLGDTVGVVRNAGFRNLSGSDGCWCSYFEVQGVKVEMSCHKSGHRIGVTAVGSGEANTSMLRAVALEIQRQLAAFTNDEYAAEYAIEINGERR